MVSEARESPETTPNLNDRSDRSDSAKVVNFRSWTGQEQKDPASTLQ